jgi:hypothetical protein
MAILHDCRKPPVLAAAMTFVATTPTEHCFRFFEHYDLKAPNLGLIYTEAVFAEIDRVAPGVLAGPADSVLQAAALLSEAWDRERGKANRQRQRAERLQAKLAK